MTRASFYDSVYSWLESTKVRKQRDRVSCFRMSCVFLILMKASLLRSFHFVWPCFNGILANGVMSPPCKINRKCRRLCPWRGLTRKLIFVTKFSYNWVVRTYTDGCCLFSRRRTAACTNFRCSFRKHSETLTRVTYINLSRIICGAN